MINLFSGFYKDRLISKIYVKMSLMADFFMGTILNESFLSFCTNLFDEKFHVLFGMKL